MARRSHDRVRFLFTDCMKNREACVDAATRAFGAQSPNWHSVFDTGVSVVCRPSQFARFLIYRSDMVSANTFRQFEAELFTPEAESCIVDVSDNPARRCDQ